MHKEATAVSTPCFLLFIETVQAVKNYIDSELIKSESFEALNESIKRLTDKFNFEKLKRDGSGQTTILAFLGAGWKQWQFTYASELLLLRFSFGTLTFG